MKIKKLYAEPEVRFHELRTSTILQASQGGGNQDPDPNELILDPGNPTDAD